MHNSAVFSTTGGGRTPSIHFLGKSGWAAQRTGGGAATQPAALNGLAKSSPIAPNFTANRAPILAHSPNAIESWEVPARFQRMEVTVDEIDAVILGGADHMWA